MYELENITNSVIFGDALSVIKNIPDNSIDSIITSPPYWGLRNYGTNPQIWDGDINCKHIWGNSLSKKTSNNFNNNFNERYGNSPGQRKQEKSSYGKIDQGNFCQVCGAWRGELGLEPTFDLYINHLCEIFDEIKRVLKKEGTCWVNIGDTYAGGNGNTSDYGRGPNSCIPVSTKLTAPSGKPVSSKGSGIPNKSLCLIPYRFGIEMVNKGWILRNQVIWHKSNSMPSSVKDRFTVDYEPIFFFVKNKKYYFEQQFEPHSPDGRSKTTVKKGNNSIQHRDGERWPGLGRNKRCVWTIPTQPYAKAHYAVYPSKLLEPMILAGCPEGGIILDPFFGSGTTGVVANKLNRKYIGIELNIDKSIMRDELNQPNLL